MAAAPQNPLFNNRAKTVSLSNCPVCKTPVEVVKNGAGLRCGQCKRVYPVRDDIPIMLPEEATVEP